MRSLLLTQLVIDVEKSLKDGTEQGYTKSNALRNQRENHQCLIIELDHQVRNTPVFPKLLALLALLQQSPLANLANYQIRLNAIQLLMLSSLNVNHVQRFLSIGVVYTNIKNQCHALVTGKVDSRETWFIPVTFAVGFSTTHSQQQST